MKKSTKKRKLKKKIKHMSMYICLTISLIIIIPIFIITLKHEGLKNVEPDNISTNLQGMDRIDAQESLTNIIKEYLENTPNIKEYIEQNSIENISLKELKDKFNIDTSAFENTKYGCSLENTSINFNGSYDKKVILLACDAFLID